uniref:Putative nuclease harbi1 n=1 Tax=Ixodes ricinus TaxID=34613 RepID=A0A6B0V8K9_IXORI
MADDASFADFVDFVLRVDELLHDGRDDNEPVDLPRRRCRDRLNPLEHFNDREFLTRYRFGKTTVVSLLESLPLEATGLPLSPMLQLLIALRFYGAGTLATGDLVNVSQATVCRVIERVSRVLAASLFPRLVKFPESAADFDQRMLEFYQIGNFPGVSGCIDCTHVKIKGPGGPDGEVFRNRKGFFSINVQAITGPQLQFFDLVASWPGSVHDSRIFDNSRARVLYEHRRVPGLLLGDAAYACMSFLLTPLSSPGAANSPEGRYQAAHLKTRNSVERAFDAFKRRFPCLDMRLQYKGEKSATIITACAALHNLARLRKEPCPPPPPVARQRRRPHILPSPLEPVDTVNGSRTRTRIIAQCFQ